MKKSKLLLVFGLAAAISAMTASMSVTAAPRTMVETTYYSDAGMTNEVGFKIRLCSGRTISRGTVTGYFDVSTEPCM